MITALAVFAGLAPGILIVLAVPLARRGRLRTALALAATGCALYAIFLITIEIMRAAGWS